MDALTRSLSGAVPRIDIYQQDSSQTAIVYHSAIEDPDSSNDKTCTPPDQDENDNTDEEEGRSRRGGAGGSGGGSSKLGTKRGPSPSFVRRDKRERPQQPSDFQIMLNQVHIAFNCPQEQLVSNGFSKYLVIPAESPASAIPPIHIATLPFQVPTGIVTPPPRDSSTASITSGSVTPMSIASSTYPVPLSSAHSSHMDAKGTAGRLNTHFASQSSSELTELLHPSSIVKHAGVILDARIHQSMIGIVWAGNMYLEGLKPAPKPFRVVVKLVDWERDSDMPDGAETLHGEALRHEARVHRWIQYWPSFLWRLQWFRLDRTSTRIQRSKTP
ncbi:hypothetical protein J3R30DRAFT_1842925 [Lentinula aciculospora]|uniref:Uncharacterized protein n=1 Tax=Lentinula aciculospora TaxID=153920 RepID=A0A9W9DSQ3_9AGAR|nr:hypothetical protein J3R30DRAFT_1842925 [Lentinula aciculospora]